LIEREDFALDLVGVEAVDQDCMGMQRQPCSAPSQPQREAQVQAWPATGVVDGVDMASQPQRQPPPGQSTHWHEKVEVVFMKVS
jgi:hypothetical protein